MKTLVLGLGNDLYGDDAAGLEVVRRLRQEAAASRRPFCDLKKTDFKECDFSGLALLEVITGYDGLLIVDTIKNPKPRTGQVRVLDAADLRPLPGPSPHYISIPQTIQIGKKLGLRLPSRIKVVAVEARNVHRLGEGLSEQMARAMPGILAKVKALLKDFGGRPSSPKARGKTRPLKKKGHETQRS